MNKESQIATRMLNNLSIKLRELGKQYESHDEFKELGSKKNESSTIGKTILPSSLPKKFRNHIKKDE
jgi:hypothetical protein